MVVEKKMSHTSAPQIHPLRETGHHLLKPAACRGVPDGVVELSLNNEQVAGVSSHTEPV